MKEKLRDIKFWLTVLGGVVILLQAFGLKIDAPLFNEGLTAVGGGLILIGVLKKSANKEAEKVEEKGAVGGKINAKDEKIEKNADE
jgi:uncharacterized membrane protein